MSAEESESTPRVHDISREATPVQEEFIEPQAEPSRDISEIRCARCGKPRREWEGIGIQRNNHLYCSEKCATPA